MKCRVTHVRKLSRTTNVCDCSQIVREYLLRMGRLPQEKVGDMEVWIAYEGRKAVVVGPSKQAVETREVKSARLSKKAGAK